MTKRKSPILIAACAWPLCVGAQTDDSGFMLEEAPEVEPVVVTTSSVEIGVGGVNTDSFKFGEYSGLDDRGPFAVGNVEIYRRSPYDGDSAEYWTLTGTNLGLDSRSLRGEYGHQGTFKIFGELDQIPHNRLDDAQTPFIGAGSTNLTLPSGWVPAADAPDLPTLEVNLREVEIETERTRYGGGFSWNFAKDFALSGSYRREEKDGTETIAGIFGTSGGNMRAAILPKPIDYTTQNADIVLSYSRPKLQAQLSYHLSAFDNEKDSLTWENPYTAQGAWDDSQDFNNGGLGRFALEPDNLAHQVGVSGAYMMSPSIRLAGHFSYGRQLQDDDLLPFTVNPNLTAADGVSSPLDPPRDSLDGDVTTLHGNLVLTARPVSKADLKLEYRFDERDNNTPRNIYLTIPNDTGDDPGGDQAAIDEDRARINRPYSRVTHRVAVDGGYQVLPSAKVGLGYDFEAISRDFTEVEDTYEHTGRASVRSSPFSFASAWIEYAYSSRTGSDYVSNRPVLVSHTDQLIADLQANDPDGLFENNALLSKSYIADRNRHLVKGAITVFPLDQVTFGVSGSYQLSNYPQTLLGLTDMGYTSVTGDISFTPIEALALSGFVTSERGTYDQTGYERGNAAITPATVLDSSLLWKVATTDHGVTAGADVEWMAIKDRLTLTADYIYSRTRTDIEFAHGGGLSPEPVPDLTTTLHAIGFRGEYKLRDNLAFRLGYRYERYDTDDFALDGVGEPIPRVLTLGDSSPHYTDHVVWSSVVYRF